MAQPGCCFGRHIPPFHFVTFPSPSLHCSPFSYISVTLPLYVVRIGDVVLAVLALAGQTNTATTLDLFLPTSGDRPSYGAMVERRDGPSWLRDDDDDDSPLRF